MADASGSLGTDPTHTLSDEQHRQNIMTGVSIAMTLVAVACVGLRVYTRARIVRNMGAEDWTMVAAAFFVVVLMFEILIGAKLFKLSFSGASLTVVDMQNNIKLTLGIILVYKGVMTLIKISILLIYLRFAVSKTFGQLCKGTIYLLAVYQIIVIIVVPSQCRPLHKLWDFIGTVQGQCISANDFYSFTSAFHIAMDVWILALPIKMFLSIQRPTREKVELCVVFGLGIFTTICSIVRYQYLRLFTVSSDPFAASLPINTWSMVEVSVAIFCASLPTLRPLFSKSQRERTLEALQKKPPTIPRVGRVISIAFSDMKSLDRDSMSTISIGKEIEMGTFQMEAPPPVPPKDIKLRDSIRERQRALMDLESGGSGATSVDPYSETIYLKLGSH
ncbi:hypothetical protein K504DRAFT_520362 [Pleomassaria siparia CBS 279.74]|uniref:Rhodopsin domain-containing protein n=1 Tax=Pleomassaria siparia CBS 279.74 TaxID=1314801 RepID=A0A6G1JRV9_9PLEO|nr:hypothetical protein K504DRAFT_520362 [Pleomassaria siparia CBS 279.74]